VTTQATNPVEPGRADAPPPPPGRPARAGWRPLAVTVLAALAAGALTYVIATAIPATYRSSADLLVTVNGQYGLSQDSVLAGDQLTAQLAQAATTDAVLAGPAAALGEGTGALRSQVSVGTVAQQNILQISANAGSTAVAEQRTDAVTRSLLAFIAHDAGTQGRGYRQAVISAIGGMDRELNHLGTVTGKLTPAQIALIQGEAGAIASQVTSLRGTLAQRSATGVPLVQELQSPTSASQVAPKPLLYAVVALVVVGFIALQLMVVAERRRHGL
jgi:capsular polysaccharide biosynthesis protein